MGESRDFQQALETTFVAGWETGGAIRTPVALANVRGLLNATDGSARIRQPPTDAPWVLLLIFEQDVGQRDLGDPATARTLGRVEVRIFVPVGGGTQDARDLADAALALLERKKIGDGWFGCADAPLREVGRDESWYRYDVSVPYWRDRLVARG